MTKYITIFKFLLLFHLINIISPQESNIKRVGDKNFRYIHFSIKDKEMIFDTSTESGTNERKFYGLNGTEFYFLNQTTPFYSLSAYDEYNKSIGKYGGESTFIQVDGVNYLLSISNNDGYAESYNFDLNEVYTIKSETFFEDKIISDIGSILEVNNKNPISYLFSFIIENGTETNFTSKLYEFNTIFFSKNKTNGYSLKNKITIPSSKSKIVSCFKTENYIICLFRNNEYKLKILVYDINSFDYPDNDIELCSTGNKEEDNNIFFKGISYKEEIGIFLYYKNYTGSNPIIEIKQFGNNNNIENYNKLEAKEIKAKDFNRNYLLNDLVLLPPYDIYYASSSENREKLYIVHISLENETEINIIKTYKVEMFDLYNHKFYKDLKLTVFNDNLIMGFSHCIKKKCEKDSLHYTSLFFLNQTETNFDVLQHLYDTNYKNNTITVDFNPYTNSIFKYEVNNILFLDLPYNLDIISPTNNKVITKNENFTFTTFQIKLPLNQTNSYQIKYQLYLSEKANDYAYKTKLSTKKIKKRNLDDNYKTVELFYNIKITNSLTDKCNELCSLCLSNNKDQCITCKYGYSFVGEDKFCFTEDGKVNNKQLSDIYKSLKSAMEEQNSQIIQNENAIFQLSTLEEQLNEEIPYVSSVDLGDCESLLRTQEGLEDDEDFLMIKVDLKNKDLSATYVQYEIYNPNTLNLVSLDICDGVIISIQVPVNLPNETDLLYSDLDKLGYNLFDINDSFYNDICSKYTANNGADMILSDRKSIIYDKNKNLSLCQKDCTFVSYNTETKKVKCDCAVQKEETITDITKISFDSNQFMDSFYNVLKNSNFLVMKCIKLAFSLKGQKNNIGSYMMTGIIVLFIILTIIYIFNGQKKIKEICDDIIKAKESNSKDPNEKVINLEKSKGDQNQYNTTEKKKEKEKKNKIRSDKKRKSSKKKSTKRSNKKDINIESNNKGEKEKELNAPKKRLGSKKKSNKILKESNTNETPSRNLINSVDILNQQSTNKLKKRKTKREKPKELIDVKDNEKKEKINKNEKDEQNTDKPNEEKDINIFTDKKLKKENNNKIEAKDLNDEEINNLEYQQAILIDKRNYFQYYYSLLKKKHLILFIFLPSNDYNLVPIKFILFLISFSMYLTINGFFFTDDTMNKIYVDNGAFNFIYQLPQILYSTVVSAVINMILKKLSLSEKQILQIKQEKELKISIEKSKKIQNCLKIRFIIFLILSSILMLFFWYFITCFCAVYENTQTILLKDTLVSFALSMVYPFGLNLLPGFFRIPALRAPNKNKKCLYKISTYVAII